MERDWTRSLTPSVVGAFQASFPAACVGHDRAMAAAVTWSPPAVAQSGWPVGLLALSAGVPAPERPSAGRPARDGSTGPSGPGSCGGYNRPGFRVSSALRLAISWS